MCVCVRVSLQRVQSITVNFVPLDKGPFLRHFPISFPPWWWWFRFSCQAMRQHHGTTRHGMEELSSAALAFRAGTVAGIGRIGLTGSIGIVKFNNLLSQNLTLSVALVTMVRSRRRGQNIIMCHQKYRMTRAEDAQTPASSSPVGNWLRYFCCVCFSFPQTSAALSSSRFVNGFSPPHSR